MTPTLRHYVSVEGRYLGGHVGYITRNEDGDELEVPAAPPEGGIEVPLAPNDARQVWDFGNETWGHLPAALHAYAAEKRWEFEVSGITLPDGTPIKTDRESQALINGAFSLAKDDPEATIKFKTPAGFVTLTAEQMLTIGRAVAAHVQAAFALEESVVAAIDAGTITTTAEVDQAFTS